MTSQVKSFGLSSSLKEEAMVTRMQGIVSILGTDSERVKISPNSLRRTLSADMSSRKWLSQHGFSPLKKTASSENFPVSITEYSSSSSSSSSSDGEEEDYDHDYCSSSSNNNNNKSQLENQSQFDIWSLIMQQKKVEDSNNVPATYVHPLVRRTTSSLSEKSLLICTESLGSETGSDGFSSYAPSEASDAEEEKEEQPQQQEVFNINNYDAEDVKIVKYNNLAAATKRATPKSFPPPISSLSSHPDGTSMLMKSHRDNGRLVLEAVCISSQNNFRAERQDGRLVLTLINGPKEEEEEVVAKKENEVHQFEVEMEGSEDEKELEDEEDETQEEEEEEEVERGRGGGSSGEGEMKFVMEQAPKLSGGIINVHRLATMVDKTIMLANKNPTTWTSQAKFEEGLVGMVDEVVKPTVAVTQSLPPRPPMARMIPSAPQMVASATMAKPGAVSFNPYEYYWKPKPMSPATASKTLYLNTDKTMLVTKTSMNNLNKTLYIGQNCKEQRSLLSHESYCIATS